MLSIHVYVMACFFCLVVLVTHNLGCFFAGQCENPHPRGGKLESCCCRGVLGAQDMMIGLHPRHESLESMIFLFNWVIFRFQPLVFGGDCHFCLNVTFLFSPEN